jgi:hypothetical protein
MFQRFCRRARREQGLTLLHYGFLNQGNFEPPYPHEIELRMRDNAGGVERREPARTIND